MAIPGTPSGVNHSSDSQTCGRKRRCWDSSSPASCRSCSSTGLPSMFTGRSHNLTSRSLSSGHVTQSCSSLRLAPGGSFTMGALASVVLSTGSISFQELYNLNRHQYSTERASLEPGHLLTPDAPPGHLNCPTLRSRAGQGLMRMLDQGSESL